MEVEERSRVFAGRGVPWRRGGRDPDAERVAAARRDPAEFVALYDLYIDRIHDYVLVRIANRTVAEDVTSQVFMTALAHIGRFRVEEGGSFAAWIFRIAHNTVYDVYREKPVLQGADDLFAGLYDPAPSPEEQALTGDRAAELRRAIARLRPEQQHLLALRYGAGLSIDEIARAVGKNSGAVRVGLHRTLRDLRRRYPDEG